MATDDWVNDALCVGDDTELFFDKYEEDVEVRKDTDALCLMCPVARECFAFGISKKAWGVWGGIYLENGKISREFNKHRNKQDWVETWEYLTMESDKNVYKRNG